MRSTGIRGTVEQVLERVLARLGDPQRVDQQAAARLDAPAHPHAHAGRDVGARRGLQRAGAIAQDQLARLGRADHQDLVDLLPGVELTNAHEGKP